MNRLACITISLLTLGGCAMSDDPTAPAGEAASNGTSPTGGAPSAGLTTSAIQHVFVITLENHSTATIYGSSSAPFINGTLIPQFGRAINFIDKLPSLPSEPHYIWMEAGTNAFADHTFTNDNNPSSTNSTASTAHLSTQIIAAGSSWLSYQEGLNSTTGACPIGGSGLYAPKHDPFIFFRDVSGTTPSKTNTFCAAHHKPLTALATDLTNNTVAAYNFITPNLCNDMHDSCSPLFDPVKQGDNWLAANVPAIITYVNAHQGVLFIVWDEPEGSTGNIPMLVVGPHVKPNFASSVQYSHSSLVKSIERILALPFLSTVANDNDFTDFFDAGFFP